MEDRSLLDHYESQEKWARARRGVLVQRVVCTFKNCSVDLIPFEEVRTRLHLTQNYCRGLQDIELARIRGSVGRYRDFTSTFLPRRDHLRQRWERVNTIVSTQDILLCQSNDGVGYCASGKVRNPGGQLNHYLSIVSVLYNAQDNVIALVMITNMLQKI